MTNENQASHDAETVTTCSGCGQPTAPDLQGDWIACPNEPTTCVDCCPCHSDDQHVYVDTPLCSICREPASIAMTPAQAAAYRARATPVQTIFPTMPAPQREALISGIHPACWLATFGTKDDQREE